MIDATLPPPTTAQRQPAGGGIALGGIVILAAVLIGLAWVLFPAVWLVEQFALAGGQPFGRGVWLAAGAGYAVVVLLVSLPAMALTSAPRYRAVLRAYESYLVARKMWEEDKGMALVNERMAEGSIWLKKASGFIAQEQKGEPTEENQEKQEKK